MGQKIKTGVYKYRENCPGKILIFYVARYLENLIFKKEWKMFLQLIQKYKNFAVVVCCEMWMERSEPPY